MRHIFSLKSTNPAQQIFSNFDEALTEIPKLVDPGSKIISIDGLGGSGKGTFAAKLGRILPKAKILSTDYLYDFSRWDKPTAMDFYHWQELRDNIRLPKKSGHTVITDYYELFPPRIQNGLLHIEPKDILIIEGFGSLNKHLTSFYDLKIWVETPFEIAMARALKRDVDSRENEAEKKSVRDFWKRWEPFIHQYLTEEPTNKFKY